MQRRHFEAIAAAIREVYKLEAPGSYIAQTAEGIAARLADFCETQNPRFDRARFLKACKGE